jgi:predicted amidophosphoribosyltransferase
MFGFGKFACVACGRQVPKKGMWRARVGAVVPVCRSCYEAWDRGERLCAACQAPVRGVQEAGFVPGRGFGHADCVLLR